MRVPLPGDMSTGQVAQQLHVFVKENYHLAQQMTLSRTNHNLSYRRETEKQRVTRHTVIIQGPQVDFLIELFISPSIQT